MIHGRVPQSDSDRKAAQRARDAEALDAWVYALCPLPDTEEWRSIKTWGDMLKWIRDEFGKDETKWVQQFSPPK